MKNSNTYKSDLLKSWEETYKKGLLTFWMLLSLRDNCLYLTEIKDFITSVTKGAISCEDQSLYRSLRKFYELEIVDYELREGNKGPNRKYYFLTDLGKELLEEFTSRNINIFLNQEVAGLISNQKPKL